ncbi:MAG: sulfurtransferase-like selenium metabolism protein YedF [Chloroflexi bacterium]|nr:sulfurtransferase-like selenium metabolism protein YedF [Chloroflexota bacterium]
MGKIVDARGLACPQPVILVRKALLAGEDVTAIVDNDTAQHNVTRMAERAGHRVLAEPRADGIYVHIAAAETTAVQPAADETAPATAGGPLVVLVASEFLGRGEHAELGAVLMRSWFHTLGEVKPTPDVVILVNSGVKLAVEGSPVLEDLRALADCGVQVLACGTCLGYYGLKDKLALGEVSNMYAIAETLLGAARVVSV